MSLLYSAGKGNQAANYFKVPGLKKKKKDPLCNDCHAHVFCKYPYSTHPKLNEHTVKENYFTAKLSFAKWEDASLAFTLG